MNIKTKGIFTIIGAVFLHIIIGSYHSWPAIINYYLSYIYHINKVQSISKIQTLFFIPFIRTSYTFFLIIGVYLNSKLGVYIPYLISLICIILSHTLLLFCTSILYFWIAIFIFGIGAGISYISVIYNSWLYFPHKKGLVLGIISTGFGFSRFIFIVLSGKIINKKNEKVVMGVYSIEIAENVIYYIKIIIVIFTVMGICGILLTYPWNSQMVKEMQVAFKENDINNNNININYSNNININYSNNNDDMDKFQVSNNGIFSLNDNNKLQFALLSKPYFQLLFIFILSGLFNSLHFSKDIVFGVKTNHLKPNDAFIYNNFLIWNFTNSFMRILWGVLLDKYNFKNIFLLSLFVQIFTFGTFYYVSGITNLFYFYNFLIALSNSCTVVMMPFCFYKMFGWKNGRFTFGISQFVCSILSFGIPFFIYSLNNEKIMFFMIFLANCVTKMLASIVLCFIEEKEFDYEKREKFVKKSRTYSTSSDISNI